MLGLVNKQVPGKPTVRAAQIEHKIADKAMPKMRRAILDAFAEMRAMATEGRIGQAYAAQDFGAILATIAFDALDELSEEFGHLARNTIKEAAREHIALLPVIRITAQPIVGLSLRKATEEQLLADFGFRFNVRNPRVEQWIRAHAAELITLASAQTRAAVREVVFRMFREARPPAAAARIIREIIGLDARSANALVNFEAELIRQGRSPEQIERLTRRYSRTLRIARAERIARTESIAASARGQQALWEQAADEGLIERDRTRRKWIVTRDDRLCPICAPIPSIRGNIVAINEPFQTPVGARMHPPVHPSCRCAVRLVFANERGEFPGPDKPTSPAKRRYTSRRPRVPKQKAI